MRRRIAVVLSLALTLVLGMGSMGSAYASPPDEGTGVGEQIEERFVGILSVIGKLDLVSDTATAYVRADPKVSHSIDYIKVTAKIVDGKGNAVKSWRGVKVTKNQVNRFIFEKPYKLTRKGNYKLVYHIDVYETGSVIDQVDGESKTCTY